MELPPRGGEAECSVYQGDGEDRVTAMLLPGEQPITKVEILIIVVYAGQASFSIHYTHISLPLFFVL